jgi:hypothetical protein
MLSGPPAASGSTGLSRGVKQQRRRETGYDQQQNGNRAPHRMNLLTAAEFSTGFTGFASPATTSAQSVP